MCITLCLNFRNNDEAYRNYADLKRKRIVFYILAENISPQILTWSINMSFGIFSCFCLCRAKNRNSPNTNKGIFILTRPSCHQ